MTQLSKHPVLVGTEIRDGAMFSACRTWRYALWRTWNQSFGHCMFIGLNPSTADETKNDPTVRRCIGFAKAWGFGGLYMLNLFAFRATRPREMMKAADSVGPANDKYLRHYREFAGLTIAAWGVHGIFLDRALSVLRLRIGLGSKQVPLGADLWCLGRTRHGHPRHPLYVPGEVKPARYQLPRNSRVAAKSRASRTRPVSFGAIGER